jgi:hypothetical protein
MRDLYWLIPSFKCYSVLRTRISAETTAKASFRRDYRSLILFIHHDKFAWTGLDTVWACSTAELSVKYRVEVRMQISFIDTGHVGAQGTAVTGATATYRIRMPDGESLMNQIVFPGPLDFIERLTLGNPTGSPDLNTYCSISAEEKALLLKWRITRVPGSIPYSTA